MVIFQDSGINRQVQFEKGPFGFPYPVKALKRPQDSLGIVILGYLLLPLITSMSRAFAFNKFVPRLISSPKFR